MEKPCLIDENIFPDDDVLTEYLGDSKAAFDIYLEFVNRILIGSQAEWRYYKDGHNWLLKVTKKSSQKKTETTQILLSPRIKHICSIIM